MFRMRDDVLFALDIGTRKVMGLVYERNENGYRILAHVTKEHPNRSMRDGQIHHVDEVSAVIKSVKRELENMVGVELTSAAVAAAGRALQTAVGAITYPLDPIQPITEYVCQIAKLSAVQDAEQKALKSKDGNARSNSFYCVGYSVQQWMLDGIGIGDPKGQRGESLYVKVVATFLPVVVVDSLISALEESGLTLRSMTLEPIAALNVVVPRDMRMLNLALVDIGAGTSDIAVTADGVIKGYGMVPKAGDEITESLMEALLLDFQTAEYVKRRLTDHRNISFEDLLGNEYYMNSDEIIALLEDAVFDLASELSSAIVSLNGKPPQAVMCIGGGSQTPGLLKRLAQALGITESRVRILGIESVKGVDLRYSRLSGPECVTSVGIALSSDAESLRPISVHVNDRKVTFLPVMDATVSDVLLVAGYRMHDLYGKPGMAMTVEVNGEIVAIKGTLGKHAEITLNEEPAGLSTPITDGDRITVIKACPGLDASGKVKDVVKGLGPIEFFWQDEPAKVLPRILVNGMKVDLEHELCDGDIIEYCETITIGEALSDLGVEIPPGTTLRYTLNGSLKEHSLSEIQILADGLPAKADSVLMPGTRLEVRKGTTTLKISDVVEVKEVSGITITVNGKPLTINSQEVRIRVNGKETDADTPISDGDKIEVTRSGGVSNFIFADIFRYIDFDTEPPEGCRRLIHRINGEDAGYVDPLHHGDEVEILWE